MRASKQVKSKKLKVRNKKTKTAGVHISGAEGLYRSSEIQETVRKYIERALHHPKGKAESIVISIEDIKQKPREIQTLPLATVRCRKPSEGKKISTLLLKSLGISNRSIDRAYQLIQKGSVRGATLINAKNGNRLEPDMKRGVRVSRLGINPAASRVLSQRLKKLKINTDTVKEALVLASKVMSSGHVIAELCVSDDPNYTTGYVSSRHYGYLRIPHVKPEGSRNGGRAFFVDDTDIKKVIHYLERTPILITKVAPCRGLISIDEILDCSNK